MTVVVKNLESVALAALIIACIAVFFSSATDIFLLYEYSVYVDMKEKIKNILTLKADSVIMKKIIQQAMALVQRHEKRADDVDSRLAELEKAVGIIKT